MQRQIFQGQIDRDRLTRIQHGCPNRKFSTADRNQRRSRRPVRVAPIMSCINDGTLRVVARDRNSGLKFIENASRGCVNRGARKPV
jgi:ribosomal protein L32